MNYRVCLCVLLLACPTMLLAADYSSTSYILRDPVLTIEGGSSNSTSFQYFSSTGQVAPGESTSTSFIGREGALYYPVATSPVIGATAGVGQVVLSWSTSVGSLANITSYELGVSTVSGGPYTFQSVGNVLAYTKTGLTAGTSYYFVIKAYVSILNLATSNEVSATPTASGGGSTFSGSFKDEQVSPVVASTSEQILLNDRQGTSALVRRAWITPSLGTDVHGGIYVLAPDTLPPEAFTPVVATNPVLFDGKYFLMFTAQDKGSGIDHYLVREGFLSTFVPAVSPYLLTNQALDTTITVKAVDRAGNVRTATLPPVHGVPWYQNYPLLGILLGSMLVSLWLRMWRRDYGART